MFASKSKILEHCFAAAKFEISFGSCSYFFGTKKCHLDAVCQTSWQISVQRIGFNDLKIAFTYKTAFCGYKAAKMKTITKLPLFFFNCKLILMTLIATNALLMNKTVRTFTKGLIFSDISFSTERAYISGRRE